MAFTSLRIFDIQGQLVATLMDNQLPAGEYDIEWEGTNDHGMAMSSGIYLAVLEAGSHRIQSKLTLLK